MFQAPANDMYRAKAGKCCHCGKEVQSRLHTGKPPMGFACYKCWDNAGFSERCAYGSEIVAEKKTLRDGKILIKNAPDDPERLAADVAQFTAMHLITCYPYFNGFSGYDGLTFTIVPGA